EKMDNTRTNRVAEQMKKENRDIINQKLKDPRVGFVTVTDVDLTNDLQHAKIFVSALGDEEEKEASLTALMKACGFIWTKVARRIRLRKVPEIVFKFDEAHEHGNRIESILRDLNKEKYSVAGTKPIIKHINGYCGNKVLGIYRSFLEKKKVKET